MEMETRVSDFIAGKFMEIRSRVPVRFDGFFSNDAPSGNYGDSFEDQLKKSAAALEEETGSAGQTGGNTPIQDLAKSGLVIFPNIIPAPEEPAPEPDEQPRQGGGDVAAGVNENNGFDEFYNDAYNDAYNGEWFYTDNFSEYGIGDYDWNAQAWDNYAIYDDSPPYGLYDDSFGAAGLNAAGVWDNYAIYDDSPDEAFYWYGEDAWDEDEGYNGLYGDEYAFYGVAADAARDYPVAGIGYTERYGNTDVREIIEDSIRRASSLYGIDHNLIRAVIAQESSFKPSSLSSAGAQGLMQLMPGTAASLGVENPWDIYENVDGGTRHLRDLLENYKGDLSLALAAYNAGSGAVRRYNGVPPYSETQNYIKKVVGYYEQYTTGGF